MPVTTGKEAELDGDERVWTVPNAISFLQVARTAGTRPEFVAEHDAADPLEWRAQVGELDAQIRALGLPHYVLRAA